MAGSPLLASGQRGALRIALGAISILLGLAALIWPGVTLLFVALLFGLELISAGLVRIVAAATLTGLPGWWRAVSRRATERIGLIAFGLISVVAAIVVLTFPGDSLVLLARIGGVILLFFGVASIFSAIAGRGQRSVAAGVRVAH